MGLDGSHLPATLSALARAARGTDADTISADAAEQGVYAQIANRLASLLDDIRDVSVDRDERRELLTLQVTDRGGTTHGARALSDGALRFLALAVLAQDPEAHGLLCLEEPENGIHPARIPALLRLLQAIATDPDEAVGPDNPFRQVIINTHSPSIVRQVPEGDLIVATLEETVRVGQRFKRVCFQGLSNTWRQQETGGGIAFGHLVAYLSPDEPNRPDATLGAAPAARGEHRVMDRPDAQLLLPLSIGNG